MVLMTLLVCAEVAVVMCYFQLCRENHRWWWRSFHNTAATGLYFFVYAVIYAHSELKLSGGCARMIYYGYMGAASFGLCLMAGAVGFLAAHWFVHSIYASLKFD